MKKTSSPPTSATLAVKRQKWNSSELQPLRLLWLLGKSKSKERNPSLPSSSTGRPAWQCCITWHRILSWINQWEVKVCDTQQNSCTWRAPQSYQSRSKLKYELHFSLFGMLSQPHSVNKYQRILKSLTLCQRQSQRPIRHGVMNWPNARWCLTIISHQASAHLHIYWACWW